MFPVTPTLRPLSQKVLVSGDWGREVLELGAAGRSRPVQVLHLCGQEHRFWDLAPLCCRPGNMYRGLGGRPGGQLPILPAPSMVWVPNIHRGPWFP